MGRRIWYFVVLSAFLVIPAVFNSCQGMQSQKFSDVLHSNPSGGGAGDPPSNDPLSPPMPPSPVPGPTPAPPTAASIIPNWLPESQKVNPISASSGNYYVAKNGLDSNPGTQQAPFLTIQRAIAVAAGGSTILVRAGTYRERIVLSSGKSGSAASLTTLAAYPGETVIVDGTGIAVPGPLAGLIEVTGNYIRVSGFTVQNVSGNDAQMGILTQNSSHVIIDNNSTVQTASAGIGVWYANSIMIRNNKVQDARTTGSQECLSVNGSSNVEVSLNKVWNTREWPRTCEGLDIKNGSSFVKVIRNLVHDVPLECYYIDAYNAPTHDIELFGNEGYNCSMGIVMTAEERGTLANVRIYNNLIYDSFYIGIGFPAWSGSSNAGAISNIDIFHNTIDNSRVTFEVNPTGFYFAYPNVSNVRIINNILASSGTAFTFLKPVTALALDRNLVDSKTLSSGLASFSHPNLYSGSPGFVSAANKDYHLTPTSQGIDKASSTFTLGFDFDGRNRPSGQAGDLGAFEQR